MKDKTSLQYGKNLAKLRKKKGISQQVLAGLSGLSKVYIGLLERGQRGVSIKTTKKIAEALGCHPDDLLKGVWD